MGIRKFWLVVTLLNSIGLYASKPRSPYAMDIEQCCREATLVFPKISRLEWQYFELVNKVRETNESTSVKYAELKAEIDSLKKTIKDLKVRNNYLEAIVDGLRQEHVDFSSQMTELKQELMFLMKGFDAFKCDLSDTSRGLIARLVSTEVQRAMQLFRIGQDAQEQRLQSMITKLTSLLEEDRSLTLQDDISYLFEQVRRLKHPRLNRQASDDTLAPSSIPSLVQGLDDLDPTEVVGSGPATRRSSEELVGLDNQEQLLPTSESSKDLDFAHALNQDFSDGRLRRTKTTRW